MTSQLSGARCVLQISNLDPGPLASQTCSMEKPKGWDTAFSGCTWFARPDSPYAEKAMAPHSSTLAWKIPWMEEPGRLQSMGSWRVQHDWATSLSRIGEGNGNPLQCSCLESPRDSGAWWAAVYGVAQSQTQLKRLSSSSKDGVNSVTVRTMSSLPLL